MIRITFLWLAAVALFFVAAFQLTAIVTVGIGALAGVETTAPVLLMVGVFMLSLPGIVNLLLHAVSAAVC